MSDKKEYIVVSPYGENDECACYVKSLEVYLRSCPGTNRRPAGSNTQTYASLTLAPSAALRFYSKKDAEAVASMASKAGPRKFRVVVAPEARR